MRFEADLQSIRRSLAVLCYDADHPGPSQIIFLGELPPQWFEARDIIAGKQPYVRAKVFEQFDGRPQDGRDFIGKGSNNNNLHSQEIKVKVGLRRGFDTIASVSRVSPSHLDASPLQYLHC